MGLNTNTRKTVSMTCRPCTAAGTRSEEAYGRLMTGEGVTFRERKRERVECRDCEKEVAAGSLDSHRMSQHGKARKRRWTWTDAATGEGEGGEPQTHWIEFPKGGDEGVSSRRLSGEFRDMDGNAGAFLETACEGHIDHLGGGKPPSSKMPTM